MMLKPPGIALLAMALSWLFPINQQVVGRSGALALTGARELPFSPGVFSNRLRSDRVHVER